MNCDDGAKLEDESMKNMRNLMRLLWAAILACVALGQLVHAADWVVYQGRSGPGQGKHIVFLTGDEEYRSEEGLPMLAKILAVRHGFKCTVLFAIDPADGTIKPTVLNNIPGMEALDTADLCIMKLRFRELPDAQMKHFVDYVDSGRPIIALRTSTHAFSYEKNKQSPYAKFDWRSKEWPGGFGQQVLGETWVSHHGEHGKESTRGVINPEFKNHPILRGVTDVWGPTDVYTVVHLPKDAQVLMHGQVLSGMNPTDPPVQGKKNDPMMPLVWTRSYTGSKGKSSFVFTTTMGASVDLESEGLRRLLVNAAYYATGMADKIPESNDVRYVGEYKPTWFGFGKFKPGVKPSDLELKASE
ncbi:MAG TPA: ThuA domain-containing protein [Verrucomicrobiota bacterium]|nr:ThuA domain-containing protein [Verrucomicrobiota bacterium]